MNSNKKLRLKILALIVVYIAVQCYCIPKIDFNIDETNFAVYGLSILKLEGNKDVDYFDSKLPITALNSIPRAAEQVLHPGLKKTDWGYQDFVRGRYISIIVALLLGLLIFQWAKELYGETSAFFSFIFYLICPNFLAHSIFVGTDVYASLFLTASFYFLWKFHQTNKLKFFILMSVAVGLAQISKFSMIFLFLLIPLIIVVRYFTKNYNAQNKHSAILVFIIFLGINIFIIDASHIFYQVFRPLKSYTFHSSLFLQLQNLFGFFPIPLPSSYINSLDRVMYLDSMGYDGSPGTTSGIPYVLGNFNPHGIWYYYFVVLFYKIPISTLIIWVSSFILFFKRFSKTSFIKNEFYLLLPVIFYLIYLNFFYATQIGIRHIMIILPALYIFSGSFYKRLIEKRRKWVVYILGAYQFISVALYFPYFLPYTNEFILNKKLAYKKIADTNLNYFEGRRYLNSYLERNKEAIFSPDSIVPGKIILDVNRVALLSWAGYRYKFIWAKDLIPNDHIHSQYLIYNISPRVADSLKMIYQDNINKRRY